MDYLVVLVLYVVQLYGWIRLTLLSEMFTSPSDKISARQTFSEMEVEDLLQANTNPYCS